MMEVNKTEDVIAKEPETIEELVKEKRSTFDQGITRQNTFIKTMLNSLLRGVKQEEKALLEACNLEMGLLESTAYFLGLYPFVQELHKAIQEYEDWYHLLYEGGCPDTVKLAWFTFQERALSSPRPKE